MLIDDEGETEAQLLQTRFHREDLIAEAITEVWGERCSEDQPGCACCDAWFQYDELLRFGSAVISGN